MGCTAVRYPRGAGIGVEIQQDFEQLEIGKGEIVCTLKQKEYQQHISILAFGSRVYPAIQAAILLHQQGLNVTVANMRFVKPLDVALTLELAQNSDLVVTVEEHAIMGGAGSAVNECLAQNNVAKFILNLGLPDEFLEQGTHEEMLQDCGLDTQGICQKIMQSVQMLKEV